MEKLKMAGISFCYLSSYGDLERERPIASIFFLISLIFFWYSRLSEALCFSGLLIQSITIDSYLLYDRSRAE